MAANAVVRAISLQDAVRREDYRLAASLKAELTQLEDQDAVAWVQKQLKEALEQEQYSVAAGLSQGGLTGMQGWWAGQAEGDPVGHLLHVKQDYSRCGAVHLGTVHRLLCTLYYMHPPGYIHGCPTVS